MSSVEKAIETAKKFSTKKIIKTVRSPIDQEGSKKVSAKKKKVSAKKSKTKDVPFSKRLNALIARNKRDSEDKVFDVSNYVKGDYSTIKIINRPKGDKKKQHDTYPIVSSTKEKLDLILKEL